MAVAQVITGSTERKPVFTARGGYRLFGTGNLDTFSTAALQYFPNLKRLAPFEEYPYFGTVAGMCAQTATIALQVVQYQFEWRGFSTVTAGLYTEALINFQNQYFFLTLRISNTAAPAAVAPQARR